MRISTFFVALFLLALPAWADSPPRHLTAESTGSYVIDKSHASIIFSIKHLGFSDYIGRFNNFEGSLQLDGTHPEKSQLTVTVKPDSVDTHNSELESKLRGESYFNTATFGEATFISRRMVMDSPSHGTVVGDLTLLGVTKPVTLDVTLNGAGRNVFANVYDVGISATATIKRSDWGMKTLVPQVSDEVRLIISAEFHKNNSAATPAGK